MKKFTYEVILDRDSICNLKADQVRLWAEVEKGHRIVFSGRRNTGKTSIVKSIIMPKFRQVSRQGLIVFVDLMGIDSSADLSKRFQLAFEKAYAAASPAKSMLRSLVSTLKGVRPTLSIDGLTGETSFSLGIDINEAAFDFKDIIKQVGLYHRHHRSFLVIDEFQDLALTKGTVGPMREALQNLPADLPVLVLGSKKHLLGKMFADPRAPFASWGAYINISEITAADYLDYINERLEPFGKSIDLEAIEQLQKVVQNIPEAINVICERLTRQKHSQGQVQPKDIDKAIAEVVEERQSLYEERLFRYTEKEIHFLSSMASLEPVLQPNSKLFLQKAKLSVGGNRPILQRLEDESMVYRLQEGYVVGDPLLAYYLRQFRKL